MECFLVLGALDLAGRGRGCLLPPQDGYGPPHRGLARALTSCDALLPTSANLFLIMPLKLPFFDWRSVPSNLCVKMHKLWGALERRTSTWAPVALSWLSERALRSNSASIQNLKGLGCISGKHSEDVLKRQKYQRYHQEFAFMVQKGGHRYEIPF